MTADDQNSGEESGQTLRMRAFLAVRASRESDADQHLRRLRARLRESAPWTKHVRWTRPDHLHLTLRFLGNQLSPEHLDSITDRLASRLPAIPRFSIFLGAQAQFFPSARRPVVIACMVEKSRALESLVEEIDHSLEEANPACPESRRPGPAGAQPQPRSFRPHITLGRCAKSWPRRTPEMPGPDSPGPPQTNDPVQLRIDRVVLFKSETAPEGAQHTELTGFALGAP